MSRTARKAATRKRIQILLYATIAVVAVAVAIFAIQLIPKANDDSPDDLSGSTNSGTDTITITSSQNDQNTDSGPATDTSSETEITNAGTSDGTSTATGTDTETTDGSAGSSTPAVTDTQTTDISASSGTDSGSQTVDIPDTNDGEFDFSAWNLILVNPDNPIPDDFKTNLVTVSLNGYDRLVEARCADAFRDMVNAAKEDGIILKLRSTYRGIALQTDGFNKKVQEYVNKGYSKDEATKIAATIVAVPGTSEHHTGLAADITTPSYDRLNEGFENTDAFNWLYKHCAEYGFILRYPKDKTEITKIIYEPWHYRYVGKEAAQIIMSEGICYEEFVEKYGNQ